MTGYSVGSVTASFLYDGDGKRVQSTIIGWSCLTIIVTEGSEDLR
jgi:hypothetical protein